MGIMMIAMLIAQQVDDPPLPALGHSEFPGFAEAIKLIVGRLDMAQEDVFRAFRGVITIVLFIELSHGFDEKRLAVDELLQMAAHFVKRHGIDEINARQAHRDAGRGHYGHQKTQLFARCSCHLPIAHL